MVLPHADDNDELEDVIEDIAVPDEILKDINKQIDDFFKLSLAKRQAE
jgi:hypothetical protein